MVHHVTICIMFFIISDIVDSLVELPAVEDNNIITTEAAIRNIINTIFHTLHLKGVKEKPQLKQHAMVHNYLVSLSLQDYNTLKEIAKLSRVYDTNETVNFIVFLNELLNEDENIIIGQRNNQTGTDVIDTDVLNHIEYFLDKLNTLKEFHHIEQVYRNVNVQVLKILNKTENVIYNNSLENNILMDNNEFWLPQPQTRRIYRGDKTQIKYFPFMASVHIFNSFQCAGSIIKSDLVITAASCLQLVYNNRLFRENPSFLSVRVGSSFYTGGGENIPIIEVYFYPDYNPKNLRHNLALMRLLRKLKFRRTQRKLKKIEFDREASTLSLTTNGITIVGWGAKSASNKIHDPWSNIISFAELDVYPNDMCQDVYSKEYVTKKHFCAGFVSKGGGACNRDVGSPGVVEGILTGVVSFGPPVCGTPDAPTVFTKLGYYTDWIEEIMEQDVPTIQVRTTLLTTRPWMPTTPQSYETTTFKIAPLAGDIKKPEPMKLSEDLRTGPENNLFIDFLRTMFNSKELMEYQDLFVNGDENDTIEKETKNVDRHNKELSKLKDKTDGKIYEANELTTPKSYATKIDNFEPSEINDSHIKEYPLLNKENTDDDVNKNIMKLLNDVNLNDVINHNDYKITKAPKNNDRKIMQMLDSKQDAPGNLEDAVLTLLYLSDSERNNSHSKKSFSPDKTSGNINLSESDSEDKGLSIPADSFKDFTKRNNGTDEFYDFLSKSELYDILSEVIVGEIQKNNKKNNR